MKARCLLLPLLFLLIVTAGCTTSHGLLVSARRDARFSPTPADKINLALRPNPSAEDAALGSVLLAEMARENFNIVTNTDADYTLAYLVEDDSTVEISLRTTTLRTPLMNLPPPPQTTRDVIVLGSLPHNLGRTSSQTVLIPTPYVHPAKGIRLFLYTNPKTQSGGLQLAWSGCIEAGKSIPADREPVLVRTLLGYFGQDYLGRVILPK